MLKTKRSTKSPQSKSLTTRSKPQPKLRTNTKSRQISTSTTTTQLPPATHSNLSQKRWAVTWGLSATNGLGRPSKLVFDAHPQRVLLPTLRGDAYSPFRKEFELYQDIPEEGLADVAQITSGWTTTLASTAEGRVFQWGFRAPTRAMVKRAKADKSPIKKNLSSFLETVIGYHPWSGGSPKPIRIPCFGSETDKQLAEEAEAGGMVLPEWMTAKKMQPLKLSATSDNRGVLTTGGHLFTWSEVGDIYGSIGQGKEYSASPEPRLIPTPDVIDFAFGYNHLSFVTAHGTLYSCGNTDGGATGLPLAYVNLQSKKKRIFRPLSVHDNYEKFITDLRDAIRSYIVDAPTVGLGESESNKVLEEIRNESYVMNNNRTRKIDLSQFAQPDTSLNPKSPGTTENDSHEAMRLSGNDLLSNIVQFVNWKGVEGKEGAIDPVNMLINHQTPLTLPKFKSVACGFAHTLVLDENGQVWSHGRNAHGELGHTLNPMDKEGRGDKKSHQTVNDGLQPVDFRVHYFPSKVSALSNVVATKVSAGLHHSAVLSKSGEVFTFGNNEYGQCGRLNELPSTLRSVALGAKQPWSLSPGKLYISPNVLNGARVVDVSCGFYDTAITLSDGRCLMAGGYLSKEGHPRSLFSLAEFDPLVKQLKANQTNNGDGQISEDGESESESESGSGGELGSEEGDESEDSEEDKWGQNGPNSWIQSVPSRDMIPRSLYAVAHKEELDNVLKGKRTEVSLTSDERYFMKSVSFGWQHMSATAIPRSAVQPQSSSNTNLESHSACGDIDAQESGQGAANTVDQSLLFSSEATQYHQDSDANNKTSHLDDGRDLKSKR